MVTVPSNIPTLGSMSWKAMACGACTGGEWRSGTPTKTPSGSSVLPYAATTSRPGPSARVAFSWNSAIPGDSNRSKVHPVFVMLRSLDQVILVGPSGSCNVMGRVGCPEIRSEAMVRTS